MSSLRRAFKERYEAVCYDMDGTLVDSEASFAKAWDILLERKGLDRSRFDYETFRGLGGDEQVKAAIRTLGISDDPATLLKEWVAVARPIVFGEARLCPGAQESMDFCDRARVPKALVTTSTHDYSTRILTQLGIIGRFRFLVTRTTMETLGTASKPEPYPYLLACWRLETDPSRTLVAEDSVVGMRAAKAAGCPAIGLSHGNPSVAADLRGAGADLVFDTLADADLEAIIGIALP